MQQVPRGLILLVVHDLSHVVLPMVVLCYALLPLIDVAITWLQHQAVEVKLQARTLIAVSHVGHQGVVP